MASPPLMVYFSRLDFFLSKCPPLAFILVCAQVVHLSFSQSCVTEFSIYSFFYPLNPLLPLHLSSHSHHL